jgi:hypothetical protein
MILGTIAVAGLIALAAPAHAQQQGSPIDPGASVVNEQTLLRQSPRIEGQTDLLDERERVLIQPAGRTWDHFLQVTASTTIPHSGGHRAREGGSTLYFGILQPLSVTVRPPGSNPADQASWNSR